MLNRIIFRTHAINYIRRVKIVLKRRKEVAKRVKAPPTLQTFVRFYCPQLEERVKVMRM